MSDSSDKDDVAHHVCPWQHAYTFDNVFRKLFHKPEKMLSSYVKPGMSAMDIGCGMGFFSIGMAKFLGDAGSVIAVDLQQEMLDVLERRARRAGVAHRIRTHRCESHALNINERVDFIISFWMVHEVPDPERFLDELRANLKPSGTLYIAEPAFHVSRARFAATIDAACAAGFLLRDRPRASLSRAAVFGLAGGPGTV